MKNTAGCPFNHFGPCMQEKCRFYLPPNEDFDCVITGSFATAMTTDVHVSMMITTLSHLKSLTSIPMSESQAFQHGMYLKVTASYLKKILNQQGVDAGIREQALSDLDKVERFLDVLYEGVENEEEED